MSESASYTSRFRPRAQSLFEYRPRTNTELTIALIDRLISARTLPDASNLSAAPTDGCDVIIRSGIQRTIFLIIQPLVAGFLVFPLLILFWQSGWNFVLEWLNTPLGQRLIALIALYLLAQSMFLFFYLNQDHLYDYLHDQKSSLYISLILQMHTLITAFTYIMQWIAMWTIWDRYTSEDWRLMLTLSLAALLAVIALMGHPCDLVCSPFILSYDSVEYNIRIGSPFLTEKISDGLAHFLNYIFYEFIISLLSIIAWRGSYTLLDVFLYPKNPYMSAGASLLIGYPLYFLLMYTQSYAEKHRPLPSFFYLNYPTLINNIRHTLAFCTCVLLWRGYWLLFDTYVATMTLALEFPYLFYTLCMAISFLILSVFKTASSIHGPMSHMFDQYDLFPHYPNSYLVKWYNDRTSSNETSSDSTKNTVIDPYNLSFL